MAIFAAGFLLLVAVARALVGRRPAWSVYVLLGFVNMRGRNDRRRLLAAGFQARVVKPFDPAQLAATIGNTAPELPA